MDVVKEQFSQIYDQYIEKIYRFVYLKVNSQEVAEDLTSKVFLKGWQAFQNEAKSIKNPGAFLYQIARNTVIDFYREKGRTSTVSLPELADFGASAHEKAILSADVSIVRKAMEKLDKDQQDIIIWHYLEDMPIKDIAELTGRPAGTIRVMLHRGLKDLKDVINQQG
jgi:RNA polymerase sigma-70 factor (ECF subfamily)